ncbi:hypothetical protein B0H13DRAFT_1870765 [Mycena leptocephala]|nr:hypothetical protein B0H13DRAFT_1870765 [Mycena leptocephala]
MAIVWPMTAEFNRISRAVFQLLTILQSIQMPAEVAAAESGGHRISGNMFSTDELALPPPLPPLAPTQQLLISLCGLSMLFLEEVAEEVAEVHSDPPVQFLTTPGNFLIIPLLSSPYSRLTQPRLFLEEVAEEVAEYYHNPVAHNSLNDPGCSRRRLWRCIDMIGKMVHTPSTVHQLLEYRGGSGAPATQFGSLRSAAIHVTVALALGKITEYGDRVRILKPYLYFVWWCELGVSNPNGNADQSLAPPPPISSLFPDHYGHDGVSHHHIAIRRTSHLAAGLYLAGHPRQHRRAQKERASPQRRRHQALKEEVIAPVLRNEFDTEVQIRGFLRALQYTPAFKEGVDKIGRPELKAQIRAFIEGKSATDVLGTKSFHCVQQGSSHAAHSRT